MIGPSPTQPWAAAHIGQCAPEVDTAEAARCAGLSWTAAHLAISSSGWRVWSPALTRLRSSNSTWPVASTSTEPKGSSPSLRASVASSTHRRRWWRSSSLSRPPVWSPAVVDMGADPFVVDRGECGVQLGVQRGEVRGGRVGAGLLGAAGARNDGGDPRLVDDPPQGELRRRHPFGGEGGDLLGGGDPDVVGHPAEGLPHVEGLSADVEVAVVVSGKGRSEERRV